MSLPATVSVVIPTYLRPDLVVRAARSALSQAVPGLEVIVVVDGQDPQTCASLAGVDDARLRVHVPDRRLGNADARNAGVSLARGQWVAFLDDDDEWLPRKLDLQLSEGRRSPALSPIVTCRMIARNESTDFIWPRRLPIAGEPWSEYFLCRKTPFTGEGMVVSSALLAPRKLLRRVPFRSGLNRHVDLDWLLRALREPGAALVFVPETDPLLIWHTDRLRQRVTNDRNWRESLQYCRANRRLFTRRAYAAFVLHVVGSSAAAQRHLPAFGELLREAYRNGNPALVDLVSHVGNFFLPGRLQRGVARLFQSVTLLGNGRGFGPQRDAV
jgi:glycosyltransferase involved in cell wall biosynthesis